MALAIDLTIKDEKVKELLARTAKRLGSMRPAFAAIGEHERASMRRNFEVGGRPDKWAPLSAVTIAQREKIKKWPGQILLRSGALARIVYQADEDQVAIGTAAKYAAVQHYGAAKGQFSRGKRVIPWGDIPGRPFLMVQDSDWPLIARTINDYVLGR